MDLRFNLIIFFSYVASSLIAQTDFRSGFIITSSQDTILGEIDYRSNAKNYESCIFRDQEGETIYAPNQIAGFGYDNDRFFTSQIIDETFVEALVVGELSLYRSKDKFHLKKDNNIFDLESIIEEIRQGGKILKTEKGRWKGIISYLIRDCLPHPEDLVSTVELSERSLTKLIVKHNKCKGGRYIEFKANKPWAKIELGVKAGLTSAKIQTQDNLSYFLYLDDSYMTIAPTIGAQLTISSPRITEDFAFESELHFSRSNYSSLVKISKTSVIYHDTYITLNTISLPLSLKYLFPEKRYSFYVQAGVNFDYNLSSKTRLLTERVSGMVVETDIEHQAFIINSKQIGYWGGVGIHRSFAKLKAAITVRYFEMSNLSMTRGLTAHNSQLSINFIISTK